MVRSPPGARELPVGGGQRKSRRPRARRRAGARARDPILCLGGIQEANSYVRINLSLFGLYPKRHVPTIPVELALVPGGLIYEMSSWTRAIVMPLSIIQAKTDTRPVPAGFNLDELVVPGKTFKLPKRDRLSPLFRQLDLALKVWGSRGPEMIRKPPLRAPA